MHVRLRGIGTTRMGMWHDVPKQVHGDVQHERESRNSCECTKSIGHSRWKFPESHLVSKLPYAYLLYNYMTMRTTRDGSSDKIPHNHNHNHNNVFQASFHSSKEDPL